MPALANITLLPGQELPDWVPRVVASYTHGFSVSTLGQSEEAQAIDWKRLAHDLGQLPEIGILFADVAAKTKWRRMPMGRGHRNCPSLSATMTESNGRCYGNLTTPPRTPWASCVSLVWYWCKLMSIVTCFMLCMLWTHKHKHTHTTTVFIENLQGSFFLQAQFRVFEWFWCAHESLTSFIRRPCTRGSPSNGCCFWYSEWHVVCENQTWSGQVDLWFRTRVCVN